MKDYYTKEQRREYFRNYNRLRNGCKPGQIKNFIGPPKPQMCLCARALGIEHRRGSEWICKQCKDSETVAERSNLELIHKHERNILWDELNATVRRMLAVPDWMRHWRNRESAPEGNASDLMNRIEARIEDDGREIVVHGHGEYHLALTTEACHV